MAWRVTYRFQDGRQTREERDVVRRDEAPTEGHAIDVDYIPGVENASRIDGKVMIVPLICFVGMSVWLAWSIWSIAKLADDLPDDTKPKRLRRDPEQMPTRSFRVTRPGRR